MNGVSKITLSEDISVITFNKLPADTLHTAQILNRFAEGGINIDMISQTAPQGGTVSLSLTVFVEDLAKVLTLCNQMNLTNIKPLVSNGNCKIQLYGDEMRQMHGVAAKAINAISQSGAEVCLITTSEVDISVLITRAKAEEAVASLEHTFQITCIR